MDQYILDLCFHKIQTEHGPVWWRSCVLRDDMQHGEQGYMVIYENGNHLHTYHYPPNFLNLR